MVADVLNMDMRPLDDFMDKFNLERFDNLFDKLYRNIEQEIKKYINKEIDVVGCHLNNSTWASTLFILKYVKEKYPHIRTLVGGPGPIMGFVSDKKEIELFMKKNNFIDYFIVGEGENVFLEILNNEKFPTNGQDLYPGDYIIDIAQNIISENKNIKFDKRKI